MKQLLFALKSALESVGHNKLRAGLTSMGILFGVASVIAMLAIGKGAEKEILDQMRLLGANNIIITPVIEQKDEKVEKTDEGQKDQKHFSPGLSALDVQSIANTIPTVAATSSQIIINTLITREGFRRSGKLVGVDSTYFNLVNLKVASGTDFTKAQIDRAAPVAIIGAGVKARFFTSEEPIGNTIKVGNVWLTVIGVLEDRKVSSDVVQHLGIRDANMDVYTPTQTLLLRYRNRSLVTQQDIERASANNGNGVSDANETDDQRAEQKNENQLDQIVVRVDQAAHVQNAADVIRRMITRRHNNVVDFEITIPELLLKQEERTRTIFNVVLGAIASISLVVGGIGIMNIMLASILERIKEIGVRRAVGATRRDVLAQFLSEAVVISLAGGVMGIALGGAFSEGIERMAKINTIVSSASVVVAFGVSVAVGLVFGIVPAWRAAQQDPVTCLHYE